MQKPSSLENENLDTQEHESFWPPVLLFIGIMVILATCAIVFNIIF